MKDTKFYPLLTLSVVFLIISFIMLCILGYNYYGQSGQSKKAVAADVKNSLKVVGTVVDQTRDSLQKIYNATVTGFKTEAKSDSTFTAVDTASNSIPGNKNTDFYTLRQEIDTLLSEHSSSADLELARYKIKELQIKLDELGSRNTDIENENKRLHALLEQASHNNTVTNRNMKPADESLARAVPENNTNAVFSASELQFAAADEKDAMVNAAAETEKFVGSVVVRNTLVQGNSELVLVLIQPDGKVLRNAWESGSFDADGGKKIYSRKIKFDYSKGEAYRLNFTVPLDNCQKGTYTLQVYSKGKVIGRVAKTVS